MKITTSWLQEIHKREAELPGPLVNLIKSNVKKFKVWLGGPKSGDELYYLRENIGYVLTQYGFTVIIRDKDFKNSNWYSILKAEVLDSDLAIILAITPGSSAEAIEFANIREIKNKLWIYTFDSYSDGYVYKLLESHHGLIRDDSRFSLEEGDKSPINLCISIWNRTCDWKIRSVGKEKKRGIFRSPFGD